MSPLIKLLHSPESTCRQEDATCFSSLLLFLPLRTGILEQSTGARNRLGIGLSSRLARALIFKQSMGARNRVGIGLSYRPARAGIIKQSMGARNRVGIGLSYRPARLHRLAEFIPWNRFLGSIRLKIRARMHLDEPVTTPGALVYLCA